MVNFWNLRASGVTLGFLPIKHIKRFRGFVKSLAADLTKKSNKKISPPEPVTTIYSSGFGKEEQITKIAQKVIGKGEEVVSKGATEPGRRVLSKSPTGDYAYSEDTTLFLIFRSLS